MQAAVELKNISKNYKETKALNGVSLTINVGEMVSLIGASGSGKSTLLRHISGLERSNTDDSYIKVHGKTVQENGKIAYDIRKIRSGIGFIFQQFNLVGRLSVLVNVLVGMLHKIPVWRSVLRLFTGKEKEYARDALKRVDMEEKAFQRSSTLSGGQQQRAAIARAIVQNADIVLADEPIASLDPESARNVMSLLARINDEDEATVVVSLHQVHYALKFCKRIIALKKGRVVFDGPCEEVTAELLHEIYGSKFAETGIFEDLKDITKLLDTEPSFDGTKEKVEVIA
ncbi:MAG: phosphonate ABC transporter ATP-binding protein [Spirochaetales bacterium]|nr:phosphonate ABC transporter ATP-binding protein [Spirochaetales bacterium]